MMECSPLLLDLQVMVDFPCDKFLEHTRDSKSEKDGTLILVTIGHMVFSNVQEQYLWLAFVSYGQNETTATMPYSIKIC
jgi:hypothetical protein